MKSSIRREREKKWIMPGIMGGITGAMAASRGTVWLSQAQLTVFGLLLLAVLVFHLWRSDELERKLSHVAATVAFVGTGLVTLVYGHLQASGLQTPNWGFLFPVMMGFYILALWVGMIRYRYR